MARLSLKDVMNLLDVRNLAGTPGQLERLRKWIESLVECAGMPLCGSIGGTF